MGVDKKFSIYIKKEDYFKPYIKFRKGEKVFRNKRKDKKRLREEIKLLRKLYGL